MKRTATGGDVPLLFHKVFHYALIPVNVLSAFAQLLMVNGAADRFFLGAVCVLLTGAFIGFFRKRRWAWYCTVLFLMVGMLYFTWQLGQAFLYDPPGFAAASAGLWLVMDACAYLVLVYYLKRKPLFLPRRGEGGDRGLQA